VEGGRRKRTKEKRTDERREGGRRDGKKEGRPTVHRMILVIQDEVRIKKQINNMKIEWRWCLSIGDEGGEWWETEEAKYFLYMVGKYY